ncbi:hypothetical protein BV22DRAFT_287096 [Leucogyrophana mollusca]|uniref:Uncharacterized protein n=1 Tax=Leucogyrophana mollusca TaxID=85980 RepID=A0ACB8BP91_9AGAM|nr:hypothetical protein BV22DRAFT_287096 [Leucogyrophana mollusca]
MLSCSLSAHVGALLSAVAIATDALHGRSVEICLRNLTCTGVSHRRNRLSPQLFWHCRYLIATRPGPDNQQLPWGNKLRRSVTGLTNNFIGSSMWRLVSKAEWRKTDHEGHPEFDSEHMGPSMMSPQPETKEVCAKQANRVRTLYVIHISTFDCIPIQSMHTEGVAILGYGEGYVLYTSSSTTIKRGASET